MKKLLLTLAILVLTACQFHYKPVEAANYEVTAQGTKFSPMVLRIDVGDTVSFKNMTGHTTQAIVKYLPKPPGVMPKGYIESVAWTSPLGEDYLTKPFTVEGVYFVKCQPHWSMGMGVAIIVGDGIPTNLDDIEALKPKGSARRLLKKVNKFLKK